MDAQGRSRVLICGGRDFADRAGMTRILDYLNAFGADMGLPLPRFAAIIHGNARGADRLAGEWARLRGIPEESYPADWGRYGKRAGPIRNQEMLDRAKPDLVIAFPGGRGTTDMIARAEKANVRILKLTRDQHGRTYERTGGGGYTQQEDEGTAG